MAENLWLKPEVFLFMASLFHDEILVVAAVDDFHRSGRRRSWKKQSVLRLSVR